MDNIELYINGELCDTGKNFGVRLKRQLINPAELNTKDAQASYSVTLPITPTNDRLFSFSSIEETKGKFNRGYTAELIINSYRVFSGNFRLSEINRDGYKGNLVIPVAKTVKDVFGDSLLTDNAPLEIEFKDFTEYINYWNNKAKNGELPPCIFPYVLYGLLPKTSSSADGNTYSARDLWDSSVIVGMQDLPPSINVLNILKHIFESRGYALTGTVFDDVRLSSLYVSYKNETDYVQPWNYGRQAYIKLFGNWKNIDWNEDPDKNKFERNCYQTNHEGLTYYTGDLFISTRSNITVTQDTGANVLLTKTNDLSGYSWTNCQVMIPASGFYKIRLKGSINIDSRENARNTDPVTGIQFVGGYSSGDKAINRIGLKGYELKVLRDFGTGDFGLSNTRINRRYYLDNLSQNDVFDENNTPKYFPKMLRTPSGKEREVMLIDPAENPNILAGLCWGSRAGQNPLTPPDNTHGSVLAAKTGFSWDVKVNSGTPAKVAIDSPGYTKWGRLGIFDDDTENPNIDIDFSEGVQLENKILDDNGNVFDAPVGTTSLVLYRFGLNRKRSFTLSVPTDSGYTGKVFLHSTNTEDANYEVFEFDENGKITFETDSIIDRGYYLTLYLRYQDAGISYDVSDTLTINQRFDPEEDILDWEDSNKFKIEVENSPESYARMGWRNGVQADKNWNAEGEVYVIAWLGRGELITLAVSSDEGKYRRHGTSGRYGWTNQEIDFELDITPFRIDEDWIKINSSGNGTKPMNWDDPINFQTDEIDLIKFLPNDVRTDEFIENFCKAFNLKLSQTGTTEFALDVKQSKKGQQNNFIDIDALASVKDRANQPLGLPSAYSIGFTINEDEEGYTKTGDNGGGIFYTGAIDGNITEQKSNFSFNWFKDIRKTESDATVVIPLPVISKAEVWTTEMTYPEAMSKRYTGLAQRFWYFDGLLNDLDVTFRFGQSNNYLNLAKVSNELPGLNTLSYEDENNTILNNYFSLLTDANSQYTVIDCYLQPDQYEEIGNGAKVRFNGDMYYVADIDGYDPLNKNRTTLKLIRLI